MTITVKILGAFLSSMCFSVVFRVQKQYLCYCGIAGAVGWSIYLLSDSLGASAVFANFLASLGAAAASQAFARIFKAPATVFYIPGILPMVPGASIYKAAFYMIQQDQQLSNYYLVETLQIAGVIAIGIFLVDSFFRLTLTKKKA